MVPLRSTLAQPTASANRAARNKVFMSKADGVDLGFLLVGQLNHLPGLRFVANHVGGIRPAQC